MTTELTYLALTTVLTILLWVPYILNLITTHGLGKAVGYSDQALPLAPWAERLKKAHYNAVENLAPFAALVLVAHAAGISTAGTAAAATVYFWARVVHAIVYMLAIPWVRTLSFAVAWASMLCIAWYILMT